MQTTRINAGKLLIDNQILNLDTFEYDLPKNQDEYDDFSYNIPIKWEGLCYDTTYIDNYFNCLFNNNLEKVKQFQELLGSIIARKPKARIVYLHGCGNNGKTTLINFINSVLGKYMIRCPLSSLKYTKEIAEAMILYFPDFDSNNGENYFQVNKDLVFLANDYVYVEHPNNETFEGQIAHVLFYEVNKIPQIPEYYKNRSMFIELNHQFSCNPDFCHELDQHKEELLVWMIKGLV